MKKYLPIFSCLIVLFFSCKLNNKPKEKTETSETIDGHPAWIMQGNIYEVNVRQYTPEGTFKAFEKNLDRLKEMGVQTLWFMPINPISKVARKGALGSYYAVSNYDEINPEYGNLEDWKNLVKDAHEKGFKIVIDWVPNHTGADHPWLITHPDFFVKDSTGKASVAFDWADVRQLDYKNTVMQDSMINAMKYWITETDIDGLRCDVAWNIGPDFWSKCTAELKKAKEGFFMLAEGDKNYLHRSGFDATYPWDFFHKMNDIATGKSPAFALDSVVAKMDTMYPKNAIEMFFTSNHDENSWNKADYATMPGAEHAPFAVLTQTMFHSVPLIYSGQEEPFLDSLSFFYKDTIMFSKYQRAPLYKTLLNLRKTNPALAANASFTKIKLGDSTAVYAYTRQAGSNKVLVILNLSKKEQNIKITDANLLKETTNIFTGTKETIKNTEWKLQPWGYAVYAY